MHVSKKIYCMLMLAGMLYTKENHLCTHTQKVVCYPIEIRDVLPTTINRLPIKWKINSFVIRIKIVPETLFYGIYAIIFTSLHTFHPEIYGSPYIFAVIYKDLSACALPA